MSSRGPSPDFDEVEDALARTRLAAERTFLAWWRSGLGAIAVAFAVGTLSAQLENGPWWAFRVIGIGFGILGIAAFLVGLERQRAFSRALARGTYPPSADIWVWLIGGAGIVLAILTIVVLAIG